MQSLCFGQSSTVQLDGKSCKIAHMEWFFCAHQQHLSGAMCKIAFKLDKLQFSHCSQLKLIFRMKLFNAMMLIRMPQFKVWIQCVSFYFSFVSGITLLGTPTEIYVYGVQYMFVMLGVILMGIAMTYIYLPVFHDLQLTSTYHVSISPQTDPIRCICTQDYRKSETFFHMI